MPVSSQRFGAALAMAVEAHQEQFRKGTDIPYISHPMAVASLVIEFGGSEDQAIAGLLHDAIEDGGEAYATRIREAFGPAVLTLVEACSDGTAEGKAAAVTPEAKQADWKRRKESYLARLEAENPAALLVTACDKLHNARAIVADLETIGPVVFDRFTAGRSGTLWYYREVEAVVRQRACPVASALSAVVSVMERLALPLPAGKALVQWVTDHNKWGPFSEQHWVDKGYSRQIAQQLHVEGRAMALELTNTGWPRDGNGMYGPKDLHIDLPERFDPDKWT